MIYTHVRLVFSFPFFSLGTPERILSGIHGWYGRRSGRLVYSRSILETQSRVSTNIPFVSSPTSCHQQRTYFWCNNSVSEVSNQSGIRMLAATVKDIVLSNYLRAAICSLQ